MRLYGSTLQEKLMDRSMPIPWTGCWLWLAAVGSGGYGQIGNEGKNFLAHRASYELAKGKIPFGLHIDHLCKVKTCINPDHLEAVTPLENFKRGNGALNGPAFQKRKTHCKNGHAFNEVNTYLDNKGRRFCRECWKLRARSYRKKKRDSHA